MWGTRGVAKVEQPEETGIAWRRRLALWSAGAATGLALAAAISFAGPGAASVAGAPASLAAAAVVPEPADSFVAETDRPAAALTTAEPAVQVAPPTGSPAAAVQEAAGEPAASAEPELPAAAAPEPVSAPEPAAPAAEPARPAAQPTAAAEPSAAQDYKPNFYLPEAPAGGLTGAEQRFFDGLNGERAKAGLPLYSFDASLSHVARIRSRQLADQSYFGHTDPFGYAMYVELLGYFGIPYAWAGENLAMNNYEAGIAPDRAVISLMNSPTHRANILDTDFQRIGVGEFTAPDGKHYFTTIFVG